MIVTLHTDGPHSPDYTRQVAGGFAEAARVLNYATRDNAAGIEYPGDIYDLLGHLYTATGRLDQLLGQMAGVLASQFAEQNLKDSEGRDPHLAVIAAVSALIAAGKHDRALTQSLREAQAVISGLHPTPPDPDPAAAASDL